MLSHAYNVVIDGGVGKPGHGKYVVDGLNATKKRFISMLMKNVQLPGAVTKDSQMGMNTSMSNTYISIEGEFQK